MENQTENVMACQSPCGPKPSGLRPPKGSGPPPVASAEGGPQAGAGSPVINEESPATNQQLQITNQKSPIAKKKATGPRTAEGKRRASQNARKHGLYANASFFWDAAIALGEDPREFERLVKGLVLARQPADTLEMVLVEDIALLIWKKARLDRAEAAVQVCNLHKHDLERRKQFIQVGREISNASQAEARQKGLRITLDAPGKFEQVLSILDILVAMAEKNDFSPNMQEFLRGLYGAEPTLRGAGLFNDYFRLEKMQPGHPEFEDTKTLFRARLAEEISDVIQEYELFLHEHVENTRAARVASTAPSHAQWAAIIRQQNALHRQLERKIRLLDEMQEKRKKREGRLLDDYQASSRPNPSDAPHGRRQRAAHSSRSSPRGPEPSGDGSKSAASPRRESLEAANPEKTQVRATGFRYRPSPEGSPISGPRWGPSDPRNRGGCPLSRCASSGSGPGEGFLGRGRHASNRKKILNRGNELKNVLKTQGLTDTATSKRISFCAKKGLPEPRKHHFSCKKAHTLPFHLLAAVLQISLAERGVASNGAQKRPCPLTCGREGRGKGACVLRHRFTYRNWLAQSFPPRFCGIGKALKR